MFVDAFEAAGHSGRLLRDANLIEHPRVEGLTISASIAEPHSMDDEPMAVMERVMREQARRQGQVLTADQLVELRCTGIHADGTFYEASVVWCLEGT
jgi:hypothetical protein